MREKWKAVPGYEGYYEVSNLGRVRSLDRVVKNQFRRGQIVKPQVGKNGYAYLALRYKMITVHSLIAKVFIGPRPHGCDVAHTNGSKTDNRLSNLRYCTRKENERDKLKHGTRLMGDRVKSAKLNPIQVAEIKSILGTKSQRSLAREYGVASSQISNIARGKAWTWV